MNNPVQGADNFLELLAKHAINQEAPNHSPPDKAEDNVVYQM
jgi:hypothetical protein